MGCTSSSVDLENATICERIKLLFKCRNCSNCCSTVDVVIKVDSKENVAEVIHELRRKDSVQTIKIL